MDPNADRGGEQLAGYDKTFTTIAEAISNVRPGDVLVLGAGFFTYMGASMHNVQAFGMLSGGAILLAFLANVMLASALMVLATRREDRRRRAAG